jgi:hypothetical protein
MKNFLQSTFNSLNPLKSSHKNYTLITGGHLKLTRDLLDSLILNDKGHKSNKKFFILHKDYDLHKDDFYKKHENIQVFNCDVNKLDDLDEFSSFLEKEKFKVKFVRIF